MLRTADSHIRPIVHQLAMLDLNGHDGKPYVPIEANLDTYLDIQHAI